MSEIGGRDEGWGHLVGAFEPINHHSPRSR
jgi:hypothetical protein